MTVRKLLTRLVRSNANPNGKRHQRALWGLVEQGAEAVPLLVAALLDEDSAVSSWDAGFILRKIGRPAFAPLVDALAAAPTDETRRRCGWAFMGFEQDLIDEYARALAHPSHHVRHDAALGVGYLKDAGAPAIPALLPLLVDPVAEVRERAAWTFGEIGEAAVPALQQVRLAGPGRLRAGALTALAEAAGEGGLPDRDRAAIARLIRIKLLDDRPAPLEDCAVCGSWLAVRTGDQAAVLRALDLSDPQPVTLRLGYAAFYCDSHGMAPTGQRDSRVFITPEADGWTLVLGPWWADMESYAEANRVLSEQFGQSQAYWYDAQTGASAWSICADGEVVRWYDPEQASAGVGDDLDDDDRERCDALVVAAAMSVSPLDLGPPTELSGHGVLALTATGRLHGTPRGALPI